MKNINQLPKDMKKYELLKWLDHKTLGRLAQVNKEWDYLTKDILTIAKNDYNNYHDKLLNLSDDFLKKYNECDFEKFDESLKKIKQSYIDDKSGMGQLLLEILKNRWKETLQDSDPEKWSPFTFVMFARDTLTEHPFLKTEENVVSDEQSDGQGKYTI